MTMQLKSDHDKLKYWRPSTTHRQTSKSATNLDNLWHVILSKGNDKFFSFCHHGVKTVLRAVPKLKMLVLQEAQWLGNDDQRSPTFNLQVFEPALQSLTILQLKSSVIPWNRGGLEYEALGKVIEMTKNLKDLNYLVR